jgi:hypothetical protein
VDVDDPSIYLVGPARDVLQQRVTRHDAPRPARQGGEKPALARRQPPALARCQDPATGGGVEHQPAGVERQDRRGRRLGRLRATQDGRHAGGQLVRVEGLGQVVVGTGAQAGDPFRIGPLGRSDEDGHRIVRAELGEHRLALHGGEHEIEDDEIGGIGLEGGERGDAVAGIGHPVALTLEVEAQERAKLRLVLDDQDVGHAAC